VAELIVLMSLAPVIGWLVVHQAHRAQPNRTSPATPGMPHAGWPFPGRGGYPPPGPHDPPREDTSRPTIRPAAVPPPVPVPVRPPARRPVRVGPQRPPPVPPGDCWQPDGVRVQVAGLAISGGMLYVGTHLPGEDGDKPDPALIDPRLPVDLREPDLRGDSMGYWPSYSSITPAARAAYLHWLAAGRSDPGACIGYVFLYFYGLERRLLVDSERSPVALAERASLVAEVRRLLSIYGGNHSFHGYAQHLLDAMTVLAPPAVPPPSRTEWSPEPSIELKAGLAELSARGQPVPSEWALAWLTQLPATYLRTPATRCPELFAELFATRYHERYGDGVTPQPGTSAITVGYRPASSGIRPRLVANPRLRDVSEQAGVISTLRALADSATTELDAYSRYLGRHPDGANDCAAIALVPASLTVAPSAGMLALWSWAGTQLAVAAPATTTAGELCAHWPDAPVTGKLLKADLLVVAQLLDRQGIGIEPDVRFGGSAPAANKPVVLFRRAQRQTSAPGPHYAAAVASVNLGMLVAVADGTVSEQELATLHATAIQSLDLSADERPRLRAHAALVAAHPPTPSVLRRRLSALPGDSRADVGRLLISIAAADGEITAAEVRSLETLFADLGLDPGDIYSTLHAAAATPDDLVLLRTTGTTPPRVALPVPGQRSATFMLDPALLAARRAESARAAAQLAEIFADDDIVPATAPVPATPDVPTIAGLDPDHSRLFRLIVERDSWSRADVEHLAAGLGLLTDGALDVLNEAAYDRADGPLWEGADPLTIDNDIAKDMHE
jgi:uncharacterized tellurite resistance protein B-like protein